MPTGQVTLTNLCLSLDDPGQFYKCSKICKLQSSYLHYCILQELLSRYYHGAIIRLAPDYQKQSHLGMQARACFTQIVVNISLCIHFNSVPELHNFPECVKNCGQNLAIFTT